MKQKPKRRYEVELRDGKIVKRSFSIKQLREIVGDRVKEIWAMGNYAIRLKEKKITTKRRDGKTHMLTLD